MIRAVFAILVAVLAWPSFAHAELPPLELVQKSVNQAREKAKTTLLGLRVTKTGEQMTEWLVSGNFRYGEPLPGPGKDRITRDSELPERLLWIALLAPKPVEEVAKLGRFVNGRNSTVQVQDDFMYVYGDDPSFRVYRDLQHIAGFDVTIDGTEWSVRLAWDEAQLLSVVVTRAGRAVLTARSTLARRPPSTDE